ncbi:transcription repressor NadR [Fusobacterium sp. FSA-380-WT-3A]|uniref:transcription repressor NadR n=1 Tax=Fusobacterium sp. FSA-380-WT-3A TaxID=2725304 RepID=UPI001476CC55|nr:transcription repressor NadR [Fusobacterium sp. FSA-380-WT-3A]NME35881.1 transcription repressor NadR [Fusobacterium sp. FSA-380-WT-3A]
MLGEERREKILETLKKNSKPTSGGFFSETFSVSRQVIVQDIALLRAKGHDIISTARGYLLQEPVYFERVVEVSHNDENIEDELNLIVDLGGEVIDVFINHEVYGNLKAELNIKSRKDVKEFLKKIEEGASKPLKNLTSGNHFHTIRASSEKDLDYIEEELRNKNYIIK